MGFGESVEHTPHKHTPERYEPACQTGTEVHDRTTASESHCRHASARPSPLCLLSLSDPYPADQLEWPIYLLTIDNSTTLTQTWRLDYTANTPSILTVSQPTESGTANGVTLPVPTVSKTQCVSAGTATIMVVLNLLQPVGDPITWAYTKTCVAPLVQVGLKQWDQDVIDSTATGVPVEAPTFSGWVIPDNTVHFYFYLANPVDHTPAQPRGMISPFQFEVVSANSQQVTAQSATYNASFDNIDPLNYAIFDLAAPLSVMTIDFFCHSIGSMHSTDTGVTISVDYNWVTPLNITFIKQCSVSPILETLSIGTTPNETDIAANGVVAQNWQSSGGYVYGPDEIFSDVFMFYLCIGCSPGAPATAPMSFNITMDNQAVDVYDLIFEGTDSSIRSGILRPAESSPFRAHVQCKANGTGTTYWEVNFGADWHLLQFAFTYTCVFPYLDVSYATLAQSVASNTVVNPTFSSFTNVVIPAGEQTSLFWVYLDGNANNPVVLPHQFYALSFNYPQTAHMDQPQVYDQNYQSAPYLAPNYTPIQVIWTCTGFDSIPVTLSIRYGWSAGNTMQIMFTKNCAPWAPPTPGDHPASNGWSAAGIFFFTAFMLSLVLCLAGGAWNYFKEDKRGWEVVPFYTACQGCVDKYKARGNQHWTPQMDTSGGVQSGTKYGGFEDRGDSYQSNL